MSYNTKNYAKQGGDEWVVGGRLKLKGSDLAAIVDGSCFYVDSVAGDDGNSGENWDEALATLDAAIAKCTDNSGDRIYLASAHAENVATAGAIACDKAGVEIVGVGEGNDRPKFTFTGTAGSVLVTAASVKIKNIIGIAGIDGVTNPFHIQAADCCLDITWRDDASDVEAARAVLTNASADRLKIFLEYLGQTGGNACVNAIRLVGCNTAEIVVDFYGLASTAVVEFHTTLCTNIDITGRSYNQGTSDFSKIVVDTVSGSTWSWKGWDGEACSDCSGGQDAAIAADDSSGITGTANSYTLVQSTLSRSHMLVLSDEDQSYMKVVQDTIDSYTKVEVDSVLSYTAIESKSNESYMLLNELQGESYALVLSDEDQSYMKVIQDVIDSYTKVQSDLNLSYALVSKNSEESYILLNELQGESYALVQSADIKSEVESYMKVEADAAMSFMFVHSEIIQSMILLLPSV